MSHNQR